MNRLFRFAEPAPCAAPPGPGARRRAATSLAVAFACVLVLGCNQHAHTAAAGPSGPPPESVAVAASDVTVGFASGVSRAQARVTPYRITRHPITVGDYRACVAAGACDPPRGACDGAGGVLDRATYDDADATDVPVTCVAPAQAVRYCAFVGGRLPSVSEWLLAARGGTVQRYAWGDDAPSCARHPAAGGILADARSCCGDDAKCAANDLARVGAHAAGASPLAVEDVLLAHGEFADSDVTAPLSSCGGGTCVVAGRRGAIEGLVPAAAVTAPVTFRCAFSGAQP